MDIEKKVSFRKLQDNERIPAHAYHSLDDGEILEPIKNADTIGKIPSDFSEDQFID